MVSAKVSIRRDNIASERRKHAEMSQGTQGRFANRPRPVRSTAHGHQPRACVALRTWLTKSPALVPSGMRTAPCIQ